MALQEQIAEAIIMTFDELGGNPIDAVTAAKRHNTVDGWIESESTTTALAGGAEMAIPGVAALTIPAGISYLFHKMARVSWGIGALKGAYIVETPQHSDLRNILTLWANDSYYNAHILDHMAISQDVFEYALTEDGYTALETALTKSEVDNVVMSTLKVLKRLTDEFPGDERAHELIQALTGRAHFESLMVSAKDNVPVDDEGTYRRPMNPRISAKLAGRLATRISTRIPARFVMSFIPLAGPILNAVLNAQTLRGMAESAERYYENQLTREAFPAAASGGGGDEVADAESRLGKDDA